MGAKTGFAAIAKSAGSFAGCATPKSANSFAGGLSDAVSSSGSGIVINLNKLAEMDPEAEARSGTGRVADVYNGAFNREHVS